MKKILAILILIFGLNSAQASSLGVKLELLRSESGAPLFSATYAEGENALIWMSFSLRGATIVGDRATQASPAYYSFVDLASGESISPWMEAAIQNSPIIPDQELGFNILVEDQAAASRIIENLKNSALVFSFGATPPQMIPAFHLDLREFCLKYPDTFSDVDSARKGCP